MASWDPPKELPNDHAQSQGSISFSGLKEFYLYAGRGAPGGSSWALCQTADPKNHAKIMQLGIETVCGLQAYSQVGENLFLFIPSPL